MTALADIDRALRAVKHQPDGILATPAGAYVAHVKYGSPIYRQVDGKWEEMVCLTPDQKTCTHRVGDGHSVV